MRYLSTAWLWLLVALSLPVGYLLAVLLLLVTMPFDKHRHALHWWVTGWCHQYLKCFPGWKVTLSGASLLPKGPCVIVANHQSMADILAVMGLPVPFKFVSKASLFGIPLVGWMMRRLQYVSLERGKLQSMQSMIDTCSKLLDDGEPVLVFPEATYAPPDHRLPFRRGAFRLAQQKQVPVVPVLLQGTSDLIFEDGPVFEPRAHVRITVMPPRPPPQADADLGPYVKELQELFSGWLEQPVREGAVPPV